MVVSKLPHVSHVGVHGFCIQSTGTQLHSKSTAQYYTVSIILYCLLSRDCINNTFAVPIGDVRQCLQQCQPTTTCIVTIPGDHLKVLATVGRYITTSRLETMYECMFGVVLS